MRRLGLLNLLLLSLLVVGSVAVYPSLPAMLPQHFNARGVVDAWVAKSWRSWLLLPVIGAITLLAVDLSARFALRRPQYINMPSKKQFLELPPEEQRAILDEVRHSMQLVGTFIVVLFGLIQLGMYRAAMRQPTEGLMVFVLVLAVATGPLLAGWMIVRLTARVKEAHRRATLQGKLQT